MAAVAAGMTRTTFEKDRLDGGLEELKIESILPRGCTGFHSTGWRRGGGTANPLRQAAAILGRFAFARTCRRYARGHRRLSAPVDAAAGGF